MLKMVLKEEGIAVTGATVVALTSPLVMVKT